MRALLVLVLLVFSVAAGAQADSYLCVADASTGFYFDKATKVWKQTSFNVSDRKFVVARANVEYAKWFVTKVGGSEESRG